MSTNNSHQLSHTMRHSSDVAENGKKHRSALITGGAGFIGSHLADRLLEEGWKVMVVDSFGSYYNPAVKRANVAPHQAHSRYRLEEIDIRNLKFLRNVFARSSFNVVVHLAAKAGVRASIRKPIGCQEVNVTGTHNLLELAKEHEVPQFVFGSSSSVYGVNPDVPWSEDDSVLRPISTKVSAELLGHTYSHLYGIRFVALRFFTVYGPRQRPDLAINKFTRLILKGEPIPLYGDGTTSRDYTFVSGIRAAVDYRGSDYAVISLGSGRPVQLNMMVDLLEQVLELPVERKHLPEQPSDVPCTWAKIDRAKQLLGYEPRVDLAEGIQRFVDSLDREHFVSSQAL